MPGENVARLQYQMIACSIMVRREDNYAPQSALDGGLSCALDPAVARS
jgi:hypothetical protein